MDAEDSLLTAVDASGHVVAFSTICRDNVYYCTSFEPRPHGALLWQQALNGNNGDVLTIAFNASSLARLLPVAEHSGPSLCSLHAAMMSNC